MLSLFDFNLAHLPDAYAIIVEFVRENPLLCGALFISYTLIYTYSFINHKAADSEVYEIDLISSGISSIMVALLLIGLDETAKGFNFTNIDLGSANTQVALFLGAYALVLIFFAFTKILPSFLVVLLGNSELDLFINFMAVMMIDPSIVLTGTMVAAVALPLSVLLVIQRLRRMMG